MQRFEGNAAYDLSNFDDSLQRQPKIDEVIAPRPQIVKRQKKSKAQLKREARTTNAKAFRVIGIICFLLLAFGILIMGRAQLTEKSDQLAKMEKQLSIAQSENTRLNMELDSRVSLNNVETYARDVLGMAKQEKYQIEYVDLSIGNKLVLSEDQKDKGFFQTLSEKVSEFLAYIF